MTLYYPTGKRLPYIKCHEDMERPLQLALTCLIEADYKEQLTYHGCYNYRNIDGTNRLSKHAYGRAIDLNINIEQPQEVIKCFKQAGFKWGGDWRGKKYDPMHFELP